MDKNLAKASACRRHIWNNPITHYTAQFKWNTILYDTLIVFKSFTYKDHNILQIYSVNPFANSKYVLGQILIPKLLSYKSHVHCAAYLKPDKNVRPGLQYK